MSDSLGSKLGALIDEYLATACPCRYPRFRAVVSRTTHGQGGSSFTSDDQRGLVYAFEHRVPLVDKVEQQGFQLWTAKCARCGSVVERSWYEGAPGGTIDWLVVRLAVGVADVGAPVEMRKGQRIVFRCSRWIATGPDTSGMLIASRTYPFIDEDDWLAWIRAKA